VEPVGIDDLNVDGSTLAVDLSAVAAARGLTPKELDAAGFLRRSVTPPGEDPVTLAVNAAWPVVEAAGAEAFELLIVATESGLDYGKPLSAYVHRHLGLPGRCRNLEVKHACYGGTAAVQLAAAWVRSGEAPGRKALVVMTDLARRHLGDPAELTAGSGAVAVAVGARPRVLAIEPGRGYASREVYDVARPTALGEWGDAVLSLAAYLDLLEEAWAGYRRATDPGAAVEQRFRYMLYHTPLVSLVRQAHGVLLEGEDGPAGAAAASFERMVEPALGYARELANVYSGSLYCLLAGLVDGPAELAPGTPVGLFSYGSGSCAEVYRGLVAAPARATVSRHRIGARLAARGRVGLEEYERLVLEAERMLTSPDYEPPPDLPSGHVAGRGGRRLVLRRVVGHHRQYAWVD
jgi:3-hydroxy-3-methylglutaryl CoA synthase